MKWTMFVIALLFGCASAPKSRVVSKAAEPSTLGNLTSGQYDALFGEGGTVECVICTASVSDSSRDITDCQPCPKAVQ